MVGEAPVLDGDAAIDHYVADALGQVVGVLEGAGLAECGGVEYYDVGGLAGREGASVGQADAGGGGGGELVHGLLGGEVAGLADEAPVEPGRPRVRAQE